MLKIVTQIDEDTIHRLYSVYAESMLDLKMHFSSNAEMYASYASFLKDFIQKPKQLIIVETFDDEWVSALRAIATTDGHWFLEAVETKPEERKRGYGKKLLENTIAYLKSIGMTTLTCTVAKNNFASRALHEKIGFIPTAEPSVNCSEELEEGAILYRLAK